MLVFIKNSASFILFLFKMLIRENFWNYIRKNGKNSFKNTEKITILGNGPSLKNVLENWRQNKDFLEHDVFGVNYFCSNENFEEIKLEYYVLSDPSFYDPENPLFESGSKVYKTLNSKVSWNMNLYVQYSSLKKIDYQKIITNRNIKIIPFHTLQYQGYEKLRFWFYKKGLGSGNYGTVVLNALFIALNLNYKEVFVYGIDHNFFDGLTVTKDNVLCHIDSHFYERDLTPKPMTNHFGHKLIPFTMETFLEDKYSVFKGHRIFSEYANYLGAKIYNCTENSLVDTYSRKRGDKLIPKNLSDHDAENSCEEKRYE